MAKLIARKSRSSPEPTPADAEQPPPEPPAEIGTAARAPAPAAEPDRDTPVPLALRIVRAVRDQTQLSVAIAFLIVGIVFVLLGWYGAAYTNIITEQIPYMISGGLLGLGLIIVAGFMAYGALMARQTEGLRREVARLATALNGARPASDSAPPDAAPGSGDVFVVPGGRSFHVAGCPIVEGKDARAMSPEDAARAGFAVCKLCGPD